MRFRNITTGNIVTTDNAEAIKLMEASSNYAPVVDKPAKSAKPAQKPDDKKSE